MGVAIGEVLPVAASCLVQGRCTGVRGARPLRVRMRALPRFTRLVPLLISAVAFAQVPATDAPAPPQSAADVLAHFLSTAHAGDFETAAGVLTLDFVPEAQRAAEGPRLARRLMFLLDQQLITEPVKAGVPEEATAVVTVGELPLGRLRVPVELVRWPREGKPAWSFSARTVRSIDALYDEHGSRVWEVLPLFLVNRSFWVLATWQWLGFLLLLGLAWGLSRLVLAGLEPLLARLARFTLTDLDDKLVVQLHRPAWAGLFLVGVVTGTRVLFFPAPAQSLVDDVVRSALVAAAVWAALVTSRLVADAFEVRATRHGDARSAGAVRTQVKVLHRVANVVAVVVGGSLMLLQFPGVRSIGMSLLASAGVVGVVVGLAAQRSISNLLAGIQISITQPIRIGDTVVVEKEWGWIEEINLTYVVVKIWDLRRLVVPISTFLEKPFENWSRASSELLGTVEVFADYRVDVNAARAELLRILEGERDKLWNGQGHAIQVTALSERTMTLRAMVTSDDASKSWDLRCLVRERLVAWLGQQPGALPRVRTENGDLAEAASVALPTVAPAVAVSVKA